MVLADIRKIVNTKDVNPGLIFADKGIKVYSELVEHGHGLGIPQADWKCLTYRIEAKSKSVTISGDSVDCQGLDALAKNTDALVMCCYLSKKELVDREGDLIGNHIISLHTPGRKNRFQSQSKKTDIDAYTREKQRFDEGPCR